MVVFYGPVKNLGYGAGNPFYNSTAALLSMHSN